MRGLRAKSNVTISIDTRSADVAEACLAEDANIINDVSALRHDPRMVEVLAKYPRAGVILMHMLGTPETMQKDPQYGDVVDEIVNFFRTHRVLRTRRHRAESNLARSRIRIRKDIRA